MKRFVLFLCAIFINIAAYAQTVDIDWIVDGDVYTQTTCQMGGNLVLPSAPSKPGYTFQGWKLTQLTPVEYLKSTGTQYIDTDYTFDNVLNARLVADVSFNGSANDWNGLFLGGSTFGGPHIGLGKTDRKFAYAAGIGDQRTTVIGSFNTRYIFDLNIPESTYVVSDINGNILVNLNSIVKQSRVDEHSGILFGYYGNPNTGDGPLKLRAMTIYSVKLYNNDVLVRDFRPVLDEDNIPCMFEKVEGKFYYNAGTGNFLVGPTY